MNGRDDRDLLIGDMDYGDKWPVTILSHIPPVIYPCSHCAALTWHVFGEQPCGMGFQIPFTRKPLASTHKSFHIICSPCTVIARQLSKEAITKLENRIIPSELCEAIDAFLSPVPDAPKAYSPEFPRFYFSKNAHKFDDVNDGSWSVATLSVYRRERA